MARPLALLEAMPRDGTPAVSWSRVTAPALVLGRAPRDPPLNDAALDAAGLPVLRRRSGGGPVLWDAGLLALDVVLPRGHALAPADVVAGYRWLGEAIASALRGLGVPEVELVDVPQARAAAAERRPAAAACFGGLSPYEVTAAGRKLVGLSQVRRAEGTLLQAGILMRLDAPGLARLLHRDAAAAAALAADLSARAGGLDRLAPPLGPAQVVTAVDAAVGAALARAQTPPDHEAGRAAPGAE